MKINMDIFKKEYIWAVIATVCFSILFIFFLCGAPMSKTVIFCLFIGAITGNANSWIVGRRKNK